MIKIIVLLNDSVITKIDSIAKSKDIRHIKNIISRTLPRRNIILYEEFNKQHKLEKCYNCDNLAQYNLDYDIDFRINEIYFNIKGFYYDKFQEYERHYCGQCLKKLNANSKEFVSKIYNVNLEIANDIILLRNKSPFYRNNFNNDEEYKTYQRRDKKWYISRYGEELGTEKYNNNIIKWQSESLKYNHKKDSTSLKYFIRKNNGDVKSAKEEQKLRHIAISSTLSTNIEKYGKEIGTKKYFDKIKKLSYNNSVDAYIEKYGIEDGIAKYNEWKTKCVCSLPNFIKRYGEEVGNEKYKKWLTGICKVYNKKFYSKESKIFFDKLQEYLKDIKILYGEKEKFIYDKIGYNKQHIFFYDAYVEKFNLIIEYDTSINHPNPYYLTEEEIIKSNYYKGSFEKDTFKENLVLSSGYNFYRVFVKTKKDKKFELEKLINYIEKTYGN